MKTCEDCPNSDIVGHKRCKNYFMLKTMRDVKRRKEQKESDLYHDIKNIRYNATKRKFSYMQER